MAATIQGFGSMTKGGAGQPVYRVTNLKDSGTGSLRDAVSKGYRYIVFDVAGEINLTQDIWVRGPFITIDGTTAPAPGVTLKYGALLIHGNKGAHDVIVRRIRSRNASGCDSCGSTGVGIGIGTEAHHVVLDQVSIQGFDDQAISVDKGARDVTIQWSLFAEGKNPSHNLPVLISGTSKTTGAQTRRVSFHHNLVVKGYERMPYVTLSSTGERATELQLDMRNNVIWDWGYAGTQVWRGAKANVINNYYYDPNASDNGKRRAIFFCKAAATPAQCDGTDPIMHARAYIAGNVSGHGSGISAYLNGLGTESSPFPGAAVATTDACTAAQQVVAKAGVRPLDGVDQHYLSLVKLVGCAAPVIPGGDVVELEGEDFDRKSSNLWEAPGEGEGGDDAVGMTHNAWAAYDAVDLQGMRVVNVRVASGNQGGTVSVRTGSSTGPVIGSLSFGNTGGWDKWVTRTATLQPTSGTQTLYLTFANAATGGGQMMFLDWFELVP